MENHWITGREILERWSIHPQELAWICCLHSVEAFEPKTLDIARGLEALAKSWLYRAARSTTKKESERPLEIDAVELLFSEISKQMIPEQDPMTDEERLKILHDMPSYLFSRQKIEALENKVKHQGGWGILFEIQKAVAEGKPWPHSPRPATPEALIAQSRAEGTVDVYELARHVDLLFSGKRRLSDLKMGQLLPADPDRTDISPGSQRDRGKRLRRKKK